MQSVATPPKKRPEIGINLVPDIRQKTKRPNKGFIHAFKVKLSSLNL